MRPNIAARNAQIIKLRAEGLSVAELAQKFGLARDTIYHIIAPSHHPQEFPPMAGWDDLAVAIIYQAVWDYLYPTSLAEWQVRQMDFSSLAEELDEFFSGEWCRELLQLLGYRGSVEALLAGAKVKRRGKKTWA